ncbi:hypothetical protein T492DRAFT_951697, partial [Pavlovales sp. CCMP2436]
MKGVLAGSVTNHPADYITISCVCFIICISDTAFRTAQLPGQPDASLNVEVFQPVGVVRWHLGRSVCCNLNASSEHSAAIESPTASRTPRWSAGSTTLTL